MINIVDAIVWIVSSWASRDKVFKDVFMYDLNMSWEAYFRGVTYLMLVQSSEWNAETEF